MKKVKIGIIGCGTIGSALAKIIDRRFTPQALVAYLCDCSRPKAQRLQSALSKRPSVVSLKQLIQYSDLIVESASAAVAREAVPQALRQGKKILVLSAGGLLQIPRALFRRPSGEMWVPSGAVAGVDGLLAAREGKIRSVTLRTRKPIQALASAPYFKKRKIPSMSRTGSCLIFRGSAREAVKHFPQNINVAAVLSLAGLGPRKTQVEIWASKSRRNEHEVTVEGDFGKLTAKTLNVPARDNPKTSYLAVLSAAATLRRMLSSFKAGT